MNGNKLMTDREVHIPTINFGAIENNRNDFSLTDRKGANTLTEEDT